MSGQLELAPGKVALPSGALWLAASGALLVAGAHLGYGWAQRRRPDPGPLFDGGAHKRLGALVEALKPRTVVLLADTACATPWDREWVGTFGRPRLHVVKEWRDGDVLVFGHLHPVVTIEDRTGTGRRLPAFLRSRRAIVLPSFSPSAGGVDVSRGISGELRDLVGRGPVQVAVCTGRRVVLLHML
jgi:metallophosphoesterase superfamily enzyme